MFCRWAPPTTSPSGFFIPRISSLINCRNSKANELPLGRWEGERGSPAKKFPGKGGKPAETATFVPVAGSAADKALNDGTVDVVWIIGVPEATAVQSFLRNPKVRLMSFPMAEAFTRIFPDLNRLI